MNHLFGFKVLATNKITYFLANPESVQVSAGANFVSYSVLQLGEIQIPRGRKARRVKWRGWMPGDFCWPPRVDFLHDETSNADAIPPDPTEVIRRLSELFDQGERGRVDLSVTHTAINWSAYLSQFDYSYEDAHGSVTYSVEWTESRQLGVQSAGPVWSGDIHIDDIPLPPGTPQPSRPVPNAPLHEAAADTKALTVLSGLTRAAQPTFLTSYRTHGGESWIDVAFRAYGDTRAADVVRRANPALMAYERLPANVVVSTPVSR